VEKITTEINDAKRRPPTRTEALYPPPDKTSLDEIRTRLTLIEQELARLATTPRTSLSPSAAGVGRLQLVNNYSEDLLFIVNGRAYRVAPGTTHMVEQVPAGAFNYEVVSPTWGLRARNTPQLVTGETFTITAR
jgi:hypothetical protein